jgi:SAM-dependent methyltransferase
MEVWVPMAQERSEYSWFEGFKSSMNVVFTEEDFRDYKAMVEKGLKLYGNYLKPGSKILDVGCGLGCTAVPLSTLGYDVTGIDNDPDVVKAAKKNAGNFGKKMKVVHGDILEMDRLFKNDSFDACISGGVLEHFSEGEIRVIMDKQLLIAPLVILSVPIATKNDVRDEYKDYERRICADGVYRNLWSSDCWVDHILKRYNIVYHKVATASRAIGGFQELVAIVRRAK